MKALIAHPHAADLAKRADLKRAVLAVNHGVVRSLFAHKRTAFPLAKRLPLAILPNLKLVFCRFHVALLCLSLTACATPRERIVTKEVLTPVPIACIDPADIKPLPPKPVETLPDDPAAALATAVSWLADLVPWAVEADGRLRACAGVQAQM